MKIVESSEMGDPLPAAEISKCAAFQEFEKEKRHMKEQHKRGQVSEVS